MKLWTRIEQSFKHRGLALFEKWLDRGIVSPESLNYQSIQKILVVRQHDYLGDFLLSTPVLKAIREKFPEAHLGLIVRDYVADVAQNNSNVDEVFIIPGHGKVWTFSNFKNLWRGIRQGWDLAIVLNTVSHSFTSDLLAHLSKAPYILGSEHRVFEGCSRNFFYNLCAPYRNEKRHQTERNLDIVRHIEVDTAERSEHMTLQPKDFVFAKSFLKKKNADRSKHSIVMHVGAGKSVNRWPVKNFAQLANQLKQQFDVTILIAWGPDETELGRALLNQLSFKPIVIESLSLRQLASIFSQATAFVGNDTGVMHLAASVGTPLVAVFGPTDPEQWKPLGEKFISIRGNNNSCENVAVGQVFQALRSLVHLNLMPQEERSRNQISNPRAKTEPETIDA